MSLKDIAKARAKSGNWGPFEPIELSERNVDMIYSRCKATEEEISSRKDLVLAQSLMATRVGKESKLSVFTGTKLEREKKSILYLLGQMQQLDFISSIGMSKNYNHIYWTNDIDNYVYKLSDLGIAIDYFNPFGIGTEYDLFDMTILKKITPTLSPNDPNFPAWWDEHKSEWADPE